MRKIKEIIIHCAATKPTQDIGAETIRKWHMGPPNNWKDIGYHYVIRRNGKIEKGRPNGEVGAHASGHNATSIGICLVGGIDAKGRPEANYTPEQWAALKDLVLTVKTAHNISSDKIIGHNQVSSKACPCFDVPKWVRENGV